MHIIMNSILHRNSPFMVLKNFADHFLQTSYDIISIPENSVLTKNLHVKHIKSARVLFFKKFNDVHMHSNTDIYIFRKKMGYITLKPLRI